MTVTLTWEVFKARNPYQGLQLFYVANSQGRVTKIAIMCLDRAGVIYHLATPLPTVDTLLALYPGAWEVENISA